MYKTVSVNVEIEYDELDTQDLIDEICGRIKQGKLDKNQTKELRLAVLGVTSAIPSKKVSILDMLKDELLTEAANKYSLTELENRLK